MRLFIAIWPDAVFRSRCAGLQKILAKDIRAAGGRLVPAADLHLTLAFLGQSRPALATALIEALAMIAWPKLSLEIARVGVFERPQILWAGPNGSSDALNVTRGELLRALVRLQIPYPVDTEFVPHVTLARRFAATAPAWAMEPILWECGPPVLVQSDHQKKDGSPYRILGPSPGRAWLT
jgi:2'-5' RNA ligase